MYMYMRLLELDKISHTQSMVDKRRLINQEIGQKNKETINLFGGLILQYFSQVHIHVFVDTMAEYLITLDSLS